MAKRMITTEEFLDLLSNPQSWPQDIDPNVMWNFRQLFLESAKALADRLRDYKKCEKCSHVFKATENILCPKCQFVPSCPMDS